MRVLCVDLLADQFVFEIMLFSFCCVRFWRALGLEYSDKAVINQHCHTLCLVPTGGEFACERDSLVYCFVCKFSSVRKKYFVDLDQFATPLGLNFCYKSIECSETMATSIILNGEPPLRRLLRVH